MVVVVTGSWILQALAGKANMRDTPKAWMLDEKRGVKYVSNIWGQSSSEDGIVIYWDLEANFRERIRSSIKVLLSLRCLLDTYMKV